MSLCNKIKQLKQAKCFDTLYIPKFRGMTDNDLLYLIQFVVERTHLLILSCDLPAEGTKWYQLAKYEGHSDGRLPVPPFLPMNDAIAL